MDEDEDGLSHEEIADKLEREVESLIVQRDHWRKQVDDLQGALEAVTQDLRETERALAKEVDLRFVTQHERDEARKGLDIYVPFLRKAADEMRDMIESFHNWNADPADREAPHDNVREMEKFLVSVDAVLPPNISREP